MSGLETGLTEADVAEVRADEATIPVIAKGAVSELREGGSTLTFDKGDLITYLPGRGMRQGLAIGEVNGRRGLFPLDLAEVPKGAAVMAPVAQALPALPRSTANLLRKAVKPIGAAKGVKLSAVTERILVSRQWLPPASRGLRRRVWLVLNDSSSCRLAGLVSTWVVALIVVSTLAMVLETMPEFHVDGGPELKHPAAWAAIEAFVVLQFTAEYSLRLWASDGAPSFVLEPMNVVDLMAIAPWFLERLGLVGRGVEVLRVFRLVRVVRVFKLGRYASGLEMFGRTLVSSADALLLLVFFIAVTIVLASSMIYYAERGTWSSARQEWLAADGAVSDFSSVPATFWWCIVTLTTVGYGDVVPTTLWGRVVAVGTMLGGVLVIAMPVSILGANFQVEYDREEKARKQKLANAVASRGRRDLMPPLQQELSKLGELFAEMDGLLRVAQVKQAALCRITAGSAYAGEDAGAAGAL